MLPTRRQVRWASAIAALATIGTATAVMFAHSAFARSFAPASAGLGTAGSNTAGAESNAGSARLTPPADIERVLRAVGITPESLAAAGFTSNQCDLLFDTTLTHLLGIDRLGQLEAATRNLNIASDNATRPTERRRTLADGSVAPTLAEAETTLEHLREEIFSAVTVVLPRDRVAIARQIAQSGREWHLPTQYLAVSRSDEQRAALRNALNTMAFANTRGLTPPQAALTVIASENEDAQVQAAASNLASGLAGIQATWTQRSTRPTVP